MGRRPLFVVAVMPSECDGTPTSVIHCRWPRITRRKKQRAQQWDHSAHHVGRVAMTLMSATAVETGHGDELTA